MSSCPELALTRAQARIFQLHATRLSEVSDSPATVVEHLGYVQIDPINVCGRMQDLILRPRLNRYREGEFMRWLHPEGPVEARIAARRGFEHHFPGTGILVAFPLEAWPFLRAEMRAASRRISAWSGRLTPREKDLAPRLLQEIERLGPLSSDAFQDERRARRVWGAATLPKATLQKLFFHGRLLISRREGGRRYYDLPERVLPASLLAAPEPPRAELERWKVLQRLKQRRLVTLKRAELPLVAERVVRVRVPDLPELFALREDHELLRNAPDLVANANPGPRFLAPLDPLIYDRALTAALWDFHYTWEVYTPPAKRTRGYYALPILVADQLVGHVNPVMDRKARRLAWEPIMAPTGLALAEEQARFARFLGLEG